jgi:hypothetical protein
MEAVFTFSGKKGKPVKIIDHRTESVTVHEEVSFVNQSTDNAIAASEARREAGRESVVAIEAERAAAEAAAAAAASEAPAPDAKAPQELPVAQGLQLLRENNYITLSGDSRRYPAQVFNSQTRQYVPTADALKTLQQPAQPVTAPPPARAVDPTP